MIDLSRSSRSLLPAIGLGLVLVWADIKSARGEFDAHSEFVSRLISPMTIAVESAPFRASLEHAAQNAQINLWFDRSLDPTASISPGSIGPTVYDCLVSLAVEGGGVVFALENVVLVGRAEHVDATASVLLELRKTSNAMPVDSSLATVHWDDLATPTEALVAALGNDFRPPASGSASAGGSLWKLPHDLWPETTWVNVDRQIAAALVLAQFGRQFSSGKQAIQPIATTGSSIAYRYKTDAVTPDARAAARSVNARATFKSESGAMNVGTTATGHRLFTDALLRSLAAARAPIARGNRIELLTRDQRQFSFRLVNKPAKDVFTLLASTGNVGFAIDDDAEATCDGWISLEAENATLVDLIKQVAVLAGVSVIWENDQFRVTLVKP